MNPWSTTAAVLLGLALCACGSRCPQQPTGCQDSLKLQVLLPETTPRAYVLNLTFEQDGRVDTDRCLIAMPLPEGFNGFTAACQKNAASVSVVRVLDNNCVSFPQSASCSVQSRGVYLKVHRAGLSSRVQIQLEQSDVVFDAQELTPKYQAFRPDGPSCPGQCMQAEMSVAFDDLVQTPGADAGVDAGDASVPEDAGDDGAASSPDAGVDATGD